MFAMIGNMIDGSQPYALIIGHALLFIPALMFTVWGIKDRRGVMFAVHAVLLAFWTYVVVKNVDEFRESFYAVTADTGYLVAFMIAVIGSFFVWFFVIRHFFW